MTAVRITNSYISFLNGTDTTISELQASGGEIVGTYQWVEFGEHDAQAAYLYLFGGTLVFAVFFGLRIILRASHASSRSQGSAHRL